MVVILVIVVVMAVMNLSDVMTSLLNAADKYTDFEKSIFLWKAEMA